MKKELKDFSLEELEQEMEKRKKEASKPQPVDSPNFSSVISSTKYVIDEIVEKGYSREDNKQYIYEEAMKAVYGKDIFKWINKNDRGS